MPWWLDLSVGAAAPEWINEYVRVSDRRTMRIAKHPIVLLGKYNGRCTSLTRDRWWVSSEQIKRKQTKTSDITKDANRQSSYYTALKVQWTLQQLDRGQLLGIEPAKRKEVNGCESPKPLAIILDTCFWFYVHNPATVYTSYRWMSKVVL